MFKCELQKYLSMFLGVALCSCASTSFKESGYRKAASIPSNAQPQLYLQPSPAFDFECSQKTGFKIDPQWQEELYEKLDRFQNAWDAKAESLIDASEFAAGKRFSRREYSVALTVCKWTPMGHPFIVSVRPYLESSARADEKLKEPMSMTMFVSMTHHELLHSLVDNIANAEFSSSSAMLIKYENEPFNVLFHLHLMAIQKAAYQKLGDAELLKKTDELYASIGGDYKRAWDIVAQEGTEKFLSELRAYNGKH